MGHLDPKSTLLILIFKANEQKSTAAQSQWIIETAKLKHSIDFKDDFTQNGSQKICHIGGKVMSFFPQEAKSSGFLPN